MRDWELMCRRHFVLEKKIRRKKYEKTKSDRFMYSDDDGKLHVCRM